MPNFVPGSGPFTAKIMLIGEAPGRIENETGIPFSGPTGNLLNEILYEVGIKRNDIYITNVVKYQPPFNDFKKLNLIDVDLTQQIQKLWDEEINTVKPNVIIAMGDEALHATTGFTGILNYRGSILTGKDGVRKVIPTIHLAALFPRGGSGSDGAADGALPWVYRKLIKSDIQRAVDESYSPDINLPERSITIAQNSLDVFRFFQEYKNPELRMSNDIESINCIPVSSAFAFNRHHALVMPVITKIGQHKLTDMSYREIAECWRLMQEAIVNHPLVGQNYKYDQFKLSLAGFKFKRRSLKSDTLLKTHTIFPELPSKSLATQASLWTREPYYKEEGKEPKIGTKFNVDQFFKYNGKDACVTIEIDEEEESDLIALAEAYKVPLVDFYYNYIVRKHDFYLSMESRGFTVDFVKKAELSVKYHNLQQEVHARLTEQIGYDVNVKSYPQMFTLLYQAMKFPKRKRDPTSEDSIIALLGNHCKGKDAELKKKILENVLEERRIRDQKSRYIDFEPDYDKKCKTSWKIVGTETARTSTNILKKPVRPKKIGLAFHTISKHGRLAKDIRSMFIPSPGKVFIQADLSQAEARIVAVLAEDWELLKAFDTVDVHRRTAGLFFGLTTGLILTEGKFSPVDFLEKDGPERFTGKMFRHAGNYDMGKRRAMNEFNVNAQKYEIPMTISEWKAGQFIDLFHAASPKIRGVFHKGIRDILDSTRCLINPYGRPRQFNGMYTDELYKEGFAQIPQSTVADTTQSAAVSCEEEFGYDSDVAYFISENHDALTIEAPANNWEPYARTLKRHMVKPIDFSTYCSLKRDYILTIPVDIEMSDKDYSSFQKVKLEEEVRTGV